MMNSTSFSYRIFPLGDTAITIDFGSEIDEAVNKEVIARFRQLQQQPLLGMIEAIPAYSTLTIYYDLFYLAKKKHTGLTIYELVKHQLEERMKQPVGLFENNDRLIKIPVCYDEAVGTDITRLATNKNLTVDEVIHLHVSKSYKVFMLGFLPGFAYMGEVDERIATPRKPQPENVQAGAVGIAGKQTGIYPLASPGGWNIIGRTPLQLFDGTKDEPTLLKAGDTVQFYSITKQEFESY